MKYRSVHDERRNCRFRGVQWYAATLSWQPERGFFRRGGRFGRGGSPSLTPTHPRGAQGTGRIGAGLCRSCAESQL
jgi:hypothetical protein